MNVANSEVKVASGLCQWPKGRGISTILAVQAPSVANGKRKAPPEGINCAAA